MKKLIAVVGVLVLTLAAAGCTTNSGGIGLTTVRGSGNVTTETRNVSGYHAISLSGVGELTVNQNGSEGLTIEAEDNILPNLTSDVRNGTLHLGTKERVSLIPTKTIKYTVSVKDLDSITASGASSIKAGSLNSKDLKVQLSGAGEANIDNLSADSINLGISGTGSVSLVGKVTRQEVNISGAGSYRARDLESKDASISVSGAGGCTVRVSDTLNVNLSGAGSVEYIGDPTLNKRISGAGSVNKIGD